MNSRIILAKGIKLDRDYNNVLNYTTEAMLSLLRSSSHLINEANNYSFIRSTRNKLFVGFSYNECLQANYIAFQNPDYSNKWFFAWIDEVIFKGSTNGCEITFTIDSWSTWFEKVTTKPCFIVREHVNDDIVGNYTQPEGLELGEYIVDDIEKVTELNELCFVLRVTKWASGIDNPLATNYGGIFCAGGAYVTDSIRNLVTAIQAYGEGFNDALIDAYAIPKAIIEYPTSSAEYQGQSAPKEFSKYIAKPTTLNGYSPKNRKLLTFPYCYLNLDNNNGSTNSLFYELFKANEDTGHENDCKFTIKGVPVIGGSIKCCPNNYKNATNEEVETEGLTAGKFPTLSWSQDEYTNWLTQNAVNLGVGITSDVIAFASNLAIGNVGGVVSNSLSFANKMGQYYQHSLVPNSARGNTNGGDITTCDNTNTFFFYKMSIREEYAKIIDDYFTRYGYKINRLKFPNIIGRQYWNYIEIGGSEEIGDGDLPTKHMEIINNACRKGVTIWHNHENIGNYNLNNDII